MTAKRDLPREHFGELIETLFKKAKELGEDYLENATITLEADGHVQVIMNDSEGSVYNIRVSRSNWTGVRTR